MIKDTQQRKIAVLFHCIRRFIYYSFRVEFKSFYGARIIKHFIIPDTPMLAMGISMVDLYKTELTLFLFANTYCLLYRCAVVKIMIEISYTENLFMKELMDVNIKIFFCYTS